MKDRILKNWTVVRAMYLIIGLLIVAQSIISKQWFGAVFGVYFGAMGLFGFGCAAGNCYNGNCATPTKRNRNEGFQDINYEEVK